MKKQAVSFLLAFTIAFPTSVLAQNGDKYANWEFNIANAKLLTTLPLLSASTQAQKYSDGEFLAISATTGVLASAMFAFVYAVAFPEDKTNYANRALQSLSDQEILQSGRFNEYLTIRNTEFQTESAAGTSGGGITVKGPKQPGKQNPIIRSFKALNFLMDELEKSVEYDIELEKFKLKDLTITTFFDDLTVSNVRKIIQSVATAVRPEDWLKNPKTLLTLNHAIQSLGLEKMQRITSLVTPETFALITDHPEGPLFRGTTLDGETIDFSIKQRTVVNAEHYSLRYNEDFIVSQERVYHNRVLKKGAKIVGAGLISGVVVAVGMYYLLKSFPQTHASVLQKYNLTPEDMTDIIFGDQFAQATGVEGQYDAEMYDALLHENEEFAKNASKLKDFLAAQIMERNKLIPAFDTYVAKNKI